MNRYGETFYGTKAGDFPAQEWGTTTRKGDRLFVHILNAKSNEIELPLTCKVKKAFTYDGKKPVKTVKTPGGIKLVLDEVPDGIDHIVELQTSGR